MKKVFLLILSFISLNSIFSQELQLSESDFSHWHTEEVAGFITIGHVTCDQMPGSNPDSIWDCGNPAVSTAGTKNWPTTACVLPDGSVAAKLVTKKIVGVVASGNLFTGRIVRNMTLSQLLGFTSADGKALITWGTPFTAKPKGFRVKFAYNGRGDKCSLSATLENQSQGRNYTAIAAFIGADETKNECGCPTRISEPDIYGLRTLEVDFLYGQTPKNYTEFPKGVKMLSGDTDVTHVNVVFASSAYGDKFKGKKDATLIVKDFEFVY